jgi:predicted O-methyltransferase YrrM
MTPEIRSFLQKLEQHGQAHDAQEPDHSRKMLNLEPATAEIVSILAQGARARRVLEIGTSNGYSTIWLAASVGPVGGRVISIDRSPGKHQMAEDNLRQVGLLEHVELRLGDAAQVIQTLPGPFDFVFFDADRISAPAQLSLVLPKLDRPALILADNALSHPDQIAGYLAMIRSLNLQHALIRAGKGLSVALVPSGAPV